MSGRLRRRVVKEGSQEPTDSRHKRRNGHRDDNEGKIPVISPLEELEGEMTEDEEEVDNKNPYRSAVGQLEQMKFEEVYNARGQLNRTDIPKLQNSKNGKVEEKSSSSCFWSVILLIIIIISLISSYIIFGDKRSLRWIAATSDLSLERNEWNLFDNDFSVFEKNYSKILPFVGIKVLKSAVRNVMEKKSIAPAVILMIASKDNELCLKRIEKDLILIINKAYNESDSVVIDGRETDSKDIVQKFDQNFGSDRKHLIVIENVEAISAQEMMSLHQFTDHENAKYKPVIIVLTALYYQKISLTPSAKPRDMDAIATTLFQVKWKNDMSEEQRFPLISRLTTSVVTVIGDNQC